MKTIFNLDKVRICLLQPENFFDTLYNTYHSDRKREIHYDGFFLSFESPEKVNDKDITAQLYVEDTPPTLLGTFTFNKSQKYGSKCFFCYDTKGLYQTTYVIDGKKYNYFSFPFFAFQTLGLTFNNITSMEIACDTEASVINRINYAVGKPDVFDMILLWKKVRKPDETLEGYWEYYQRSRLKKAPRPTLYIHGNKTESGNTCELKVYDKARELAQSRPDKDVLTRAWNGMSDTMQRLEIYVENKQIKTYFKYLCKSYPNKWSTNSPLHTRSQQLEVFRKGLEHFFYELGMNEGVREELFTYFANHLLHFKLRNHAKTQISILDLSVNSLRSLQRLGQKKRKR